ncbi:hypothetical protein GCM10022285_50850 [Streptomyces tunisiensis]|uniref:DUF1524 domain-containing protein n=1 Tax=Streptomyces tunisiensis TaxID=948699 RepID=A0ABP7Z225_9ACTN
MVPLAEAWDSGAYAWTSARREAYAHGQGSAVSLVTAHSNRSKSAEWLPPAADVHCRYVVEWVGTKLRWSLTADEVQVTALSQVAESCLG